MHSQNLEKPCELYGMLMPLHAVQSDTEMFWLTSLNKVGTALAHFCLTQFFLRMTQTCRHFSLHELLQINSAILISDPDSLFHLLCV